MKDEVISAFAFKVGKELEKLVEERDNDLKRELVKLEVSVLRFRREIKNSGNTNMLKLFDDCFNIKEAREGTL